MLIAKLDGRQKGYKGGIQLGVRSKYPEEKEVLLYDMDNLKINAITYWGTTGTPHKIHEASYNYLCQLSYIQCTNKTKKL